MARHRSTKAEVARRVAEIFPLVCDCFSLREIRSIINCQDDLGSHHLRFDLEVLHHALPCTAA